MEKTVTFAAWEATKARNIEARVKAEAPAMAELLDDLIQSDGLPPGHVGYISKASLLRRARAIFARIDGRAAQ